MWTWKQITVRMIPKPIGSAVNAKAAQTQGALTKKPAETPLHAPKLDDVE